MNLQNRIDRLAKAMHQDKGGRCELCWNRPEHVLVDVPLVFIPDNGRGDPRPPPRATEGDKGNPCPKCGWKPRVTEITEVVIYPVEASAPVG